MRTVTGLATVGGSPHREVERFSIGDATAEFFVTTDAEADNEDLESERSEIAYVLDALDDDDVFWDVGANVGIYACFAGTALPDGQVVAFEPSPVTAGRLAENLERNDVVGLVFRKALAAETGTVRFGVDDSDPLGRMSSLTTDHLEKTRTVEAFDAGTFVERYSVPEPTVVKIDVEGGEYDVLRGLEPVLPSVRLLYCELHHELLADAGASTGAVRDLLSDRGFELETVRDWSKAALVRAERPDARDGA